MTTNVNLLGEHFFWYRCRIVIVCSVTVALWMHAESYGKQWKAQKAIAWNLGYKSRNYDANINRAILGNNFY